MTTVEYVVAYVAYVTKTLAALVALVAMSLLGLSDLPVSWKLPLLITGTVAGAIAVFKLENGPRPPGRADR